MPVNHITATRSTSGFSVSPADYYSQGLSIDGSISFVNQYDGYPMAIYLRDTPEASSIATYYIQNGETVSFKAAFPGIDLEGKYIASDYVDFIAVELVVPTTACYWEDGAACSVNDTLSTGNVTLSWSGATAGTANAITGYEVQRCESSNGSTWGSWAALTTTTATSLSVAPPATPGNYYKYRVRTLGAAGSAYYSGWKESTNTLRRDHAALAGFTDPTLTAGVSPVKALHMTELHARVNTLRTFYGLSAYAFSPIDARGIAGWTDHVNEIRAAIEGVCTSSGKTHEAWISFSVNCPRADVISQLRAVVLAL